MNDILYNYPLLITLEDVYVPELAPLVIEVAGEYKSEVRGLVIHWVAMQAQAQMESNCN